MDTFLQDLRYALRSMSRQRAFTAIAVFTLAVGIGANTAIYSVVDAILLRPLPFREPDRLMKVSLTAPGRAGGFPARDDMVWSLPKYEVFQKMQQAFEDTAVYRQSAMNLTGSDEPERLNAEVVGASYFPMLGVSAQAGRVFLPQEDAVPERDRVAMLSAGLWQRRFGADPQIAGKTISLDQRNFTIVGVLPAGFQGLSGPADVWLPAHITSAEEYSQAQSHSWDMVARLKPGVSVAQAQAEVKLLGPRIEQAFPARNARGWGAKARTLDETRTDPVIRRSVLVLFGAVTCVLMIACVNVANLLLARGTVRRREIAVRLAVGASRVRLVRQLLTESVVLSSMGAAASLLLAWWGVRSLSAMQQLAGNSVGRSFAGLMALGMRSIRLDLSALLFTCAVAVATGILFGLAPALEGSRADLTDSLKNAGQRPGGVIGKSVLVVVEVALAVVLLVGAGLMLKSFGRLIATRSGVDPENVLTVRINLPSTLSDQAVALNFFQAVEQRAAALPGAVSAGLMNCYALSAGCNGTNIRFLDRAPVAPGTEPIVGVHFASAEYFHTMKIPLQRGRVFGTSDRRGTPKVVLVNETAARRFWPGEDPLGKRVSVGQGGFSDGAEVVGLVGDVRYGQMDEAPRPDVYLPVTQSPRFSMLLFVRTAGNPAALAQAVQGEVHTLNRDLPVYDVKTMAERVRDATARARFSAVLLGVFAAIALVLAAVGIYGVMSYLVTQRTREIGIRIALGAGSARVVGLVVRRGAGLALAGIAAGVGGALAATRVLATLLYEVKPGDTETYVTIAGVLAVVALVASYIPARRASGVDPSTALRAE